MLKRETVATVGGGGAPDQADVGSSGRRRVPTRYLVLGLLFVITTVNYADRSSLSITGSAVKEGLGFTSVQLGYVFSAFSWAYVVAQLPGGMLLDRFGARRVYAGSLVLWTAVTAAISLVGVVTVPVLAALVLVFGLRLLLGAFESPAFPANARVATMWFPTAERGRATAVFNSAQYFATVMFAPIMAWVTHVYGWRWVFVLLGVLGFGLAVLWARWMNTPREHRRVTPEELESIRASGALVDLDERGTVQAERAPLNRRTLARIFSTRPLWGVYLFQYAVNALTYFFITWFPVYLNKGRGLSLVDVGFIAALPALAGFVGGLGGGVVSDAILRRGGSLTVARKIPAAVGMVLTIAIALSNFSDSTTVIVVIMVVAFLGKGVGSLGWAITTDIAPPQAMSFVGATMNACGNIAGIVTPIVIGYLVEATGSFDTALWFVAGHGVLALIALAVMGTIQRIHFDQES
ncbi:MFS transporter [Nocardia sp. NBC_00565]|uniref:MFS transporter n=1 Tax=Nocardia sp. NBC_00565 TaxID=2975993 RepID=UPI002E7FFE70|nr:MFS transporter [Nocardia sp. NBC_00565]WUC07046.1 MFS transporter [Nocardia sp. NBC_00565]